MAHCKANQLDMHGFCNRFDAPCIKQNCRFFGVKTNADRIRAMTDEELAEFIRDVSHECEDAHWGSKCQRCDFPWCSSDQTLAWLQQPAEETP